MPILVPRIASEFSPIYIPRADMFEGPDSTHLKSGVVYEDWIPNDHSIVKGPDNSWHMFGITGPNSPICHEAEWMSFHAVLQCQHSDSILGQRLWDEYPKILYPSSRPAERKDLWAPYCVHWEGVYYLYYGPCEIRYATSLDLYHWTPQGMLFEQDGYTRDPFVFHHDGIHHMAYVAGQSVYLRTSSDMASWGEPLEIFRMPFDGSPESPSIVPIDGAYYLFWCIYDGSNSYDKRTFVFRSQTLESFNARAPITVMRAHAPEIVQDDAGHWYITSAEWPVRGVSMARLIWESIEL